MRKEDKEEKDYEDAKRRMIYNIKLEMLLSKIISGALKEYFPDTKFEANFTEFKTGTGVFKVNFSGADAKAEAYLKGFPQNGAFKPSGIKLLFNDNGSKGVVEFKNINGKFKPIKSGQFERLLNCGIEPNREDIIKRINEAMHRYTKEAVHFNEGRKMRDEARLENSGLYYENFKLNLY